MRARYSAFALHHEAFLLASWHPSTRPRSVTFEPAVRWTGLDVVATVRGGVLDTEGTVEFVASYEGGSLREVSRFERVDGRWLYVNPEA
jgi:SEC-C motif-containing protein